jgi:hypothetical protein
MAAFVQAGLATGSSRTEWALEQRFPKPSTRPISLNHLQSANQDAACAIYCGDERLIPAENSNFKLLFRIETNPLQSRFVLDIRWGPQLSQTNVSASFSAYDDFSQEHRTDRAGLNWQGSHGNVAPSGPLDFSRQLYQVLYRTGADKPAAPFFFLVISQQTSLTSPGVLINALDTTSHSLATICHPTLSRPLTNSE